MRTSIIKECKNSQVGKKSSIKNQRDTLQLQNASFLTGISTITSPTGTNKTSTKNNELPEEAKSSNIKDKARNLFYSTTLVEHRVLQPGSNSTSFSSTNISHKKESKKISHIKMRTKSREHFREIFEKIQLADQDSGVLGDI